MLFTSSFGRVFHLRWLSGNRADTSAAGFGSGAAVTSGLMCKKKTSNLASAICSRAGGGGGGEGENGKGREA